jgi:hypothetical protein
MHALISTAGRRPRQRTTAYDDAPPERIDAGRNAPELDEIVNTPPRKRAGRATLVRNAPGIGIVSLG